MCSSTAWLKKASVEAEKNEFFPYNVSDAVRVKYRKGTKTNKNDIKINDKY